MEVDFKEQGRTYSKAGQDRNAYITGALGGKVVVLAYPRDMGTLNAGERGKSKRGCAKLCTGQIGPEPDAGVASSGST